MRMLDDEIARAHRTKMPFSVALIDLDWFKRINDAYGHPTGDEVLRTFAITVFANIRNMDRFGRYGGEEFLLILPETPHDVAARILDRQREIIADLDWSAFFAGHERDDIRPASRRLAPDEAPTPPSRARRQRAFTQPRHGDATASPAPDRFFKRTRRLTV